MLYKNMLRTNDLIFSLLALTRKIFNLNENDLVESMLDLMTFNFNIILNYQLF